MSSLLQICGVALLAAFCASLLKKLPGGGSPGSVGTAVSAVGLLLLLALAFGRYREAAEAVKNASEGVGFGRYGELMLKSLGVGLTVKVASDVCRDCGEEALAGGIETAGKLEILLLCLPFVTELLTLASGLLS